MNSLSNHCYLSTKESVNDCRSGIITSSSTVLSKVTTTTFEDSNKQELTLEQGVDEVNNLRKSFSKKLNIDCSIKEEEIKTKEPKFDYNFILFAPSNRNNKIHGFSPSVTFHNDNEGNEILVKGILTNIKKIKDNQKISKKQRMKDILINNSNR
ncbi:hypothetical protein ABK040_012938 [Willaertia magna]